MSNPERLAFPWPRLTRPMDVVPWAAQLIDLLSRLLDAAPQNFAKTSGVAYILPLASSMENRAFYIVATTNTPVGVHPGEKPIDGNTNVSNQAIFVSDGFVWHRII